jgi:hypothetical protein
LWTDSKSSHQKWYRKARAMFSGGRHGYPSLLWIEFARPIISDSKHANNGSCALNLKVKLSAESPRIMNDSMFGLKTSRPWTRFYRHCTISSSRVLLKDTVSFSCDDRFIECALGEVMYTRSNNVEFERIKISGTLCYQDLSSLMLWKCDKWVSSRSTLKKLSEKDR